MPATTMEVVEPILATTTSKNDGDDETEEDAFSSLVVAFREIFILSAFSDIIGSICDLRSSSSGPLIRCGRRNINAVVVVLLLAVVGRPNACTMEAGEDAKQKDVINTIKSSFPLIAGAVFIVPLVVLPAFLAHLCNERESSNKVEPSLVSSMRNTD